MSQHPMRYFLLFFFISVQIEFNRLSAIGQNVLLRKLLRNISRISHLRAISTIFVQPGVLPYSPHVALSGGILFFFVSPLRTLFL